MINKIKLLFFGILLTTIAQAQTTDVWDFGATQLDNTLYNNWLNETVINSWYASTITPGSAGTTNTMPLTFTAGALSWTGGSSDRLRTTNTAITRYDTNVASVTNFNGRVYCNANAPITSGLPTSRYFTFELNEDDEVKIIARGDTAGLLSFIYEPNPSLQTDNFPTTTASGSVTEVNFVARFAGNYRFYDATAKSSVYRVYRKNATYTSVTGNIDVSQASGIPSGYSIVFTNEAGKSWTSQIASGSYSVNLPAGYSYEASLVNASGFIISSGDAIDLTAVNSPTFSHAITISQVSLFSVTGSISGLGTTISNLALAFTPNQSSGSIYVPNPIINISNSTYTVQLEPNIQYTISAQGVNDAEILSNTLTVTQNTSANIAFTPKPVFPVNVNVIGLSASELGNLQLIFTNLNESGYSYTFNNLNAISLRNGTYAISFSGLDNHAVELEPVSNLTINGTAATKALVFKPVTTWSFNDKAFVSTTSIYYKGMALNGNVTSVTTSGHLLAKSGATIQVPVSQGKKVIVSYYYTANFSIENGLSITTATNSTSIVENAEFVYTGTSDGNVNIAVGGATSLTTYFTEIKVVPNLAYSPTITVGIDKDYQTINEALKAISYMTRTNSERVTILIDSGNYEEMLVITQPNITLKNASTIPNTNLINSGVNITEGAVRVTSYYGHGYNYFSMSNQKWSQEALAINTQNGYLSHQNAGSGTTNGSYWNATVVVNANGFEAENIIFENSFNQYISLKESQDEVIAWTSGSPGIRPTNAGNTSVQNKNFVERAAAIAIANNIDKVILNKCRVVGRQDSFFGGTGARVAIYKGDIMGAVDFIFGGMTAVFYKSNLTMNISDQSNDLSYITAAQQASGRGFLMYECKITSAIPEIESASTYKAKPGYFGRPWLANTSEVVFYNTTIETSNAPGFIGNSLIMPLGWLNTLSGNSAGMQEYGTVELSGANNTPARASWATTLASQFLNDGSPITTLNFTQGNDGWDPFPFLIANDALGNEHFNVTTSVQVFGIKDTITISNVKGNTAVKVFSTSGSLVKTFAIDSDFRFNMPAGIWIVVVKASDGNKSVKVITN